MMLDSVFGLSLALTVSLQSPLPQAEAGARLPALSVHTREAQLLPYVQKATACILHRAGARVHVELPGDALNALIARSMRACAGPLRAMVGAHDRLHGEGSGENFLLGPYLDVLPAAVLREVHRGGR